MTPPRPPLPVSLTPGPAFRIAMEVGTHVAEPSLTEVVALFHPNGRFLHPTQPQQDCFCSSIPIPRTGCLAGHLEIRLAAGLPNTAGHSESRFSAG